MQQFRFLKTWKWIAGGIVSVFLLAWWFNPLYAAGLSWSFAHGESSSAFWGGKLGFPFWASFAISTACSSFDIFSWFCLYAQVKKFYDRLVQPLYQEVDRRIDVRTINGKGEWARIAFRYCQGIYYLLVPRPGTSINEKKTFRRAARRYLPLLAYGFVPTCIGTGVGYSFSFGLNLGVAGVMLAIGNAGKMAVFGYFAVKVPFWSVVPIFFFGPMAIRYAIDRFLKHENN